MSYPCIDPRSGDTYWFKTKEEADSGYGILHREDGPAVEWANGHKEWWIDGQLHRDDGPAVEYVMLKVKDSYKTFALRGVMMTKEEFKRRELVQAIKAWQKE